MKNTMNLSQQSCKPCRGDEPPLNPDRYQDYLSAVPEWSIEDREIDQLTREFTLGNFSEVITFVERIAEVAEAQGHHPNLYIHDYKQLKVELYTHKIQGLHQNDFILASKIDELWKNFQ